ncbi:glucosaminidase domain-containing protein [Parapedobacter defluvii]|uniref:glucosaminidase domain and LysM peptidoglycan-binding domain-containing protein n=1 Tax=Parapedobacter defluvii TaxID=2045106 RepID=UPI003340BA40
MEGTSKSIRIALCLTIGWIVGFASHSMAQEYTAQRYIEQYKDAAVHYMEEYGCPASIILAIAMHESAHGGSRVARYLNNHFGIKGPNTSKEIRSAYKGYASVEESYADFIEFLKRRKGSRELFERYQPHEYQKWVQGIARSGYAHSPSWSAKVIGIIREYNLDDLDSQPAAGEVAASLDEPVETETYTVKQGDTLYDIARKYGTTVKDLQRNNGLTHSRLHIGQQLIL